MSEVLGKLASDYQSHRQYVQQLERNLQAAQQKIVSYKELQAQVQPRTMMSNKGPGLTSADRSANATPGASPSPSRLAGENRYVGIHIRLYI